MVGHRNIKRLVQFSAVGFLILTFLIFAQWEDISYVSSLKRRSFGLVNEDDIAKDEDLIKLEEKLDVNRLLKKIERDVALRIQKREGLFNDNTRHHNRRLVNNDNDTEDSVRSTEHPISHSAGTQQVDNPTTDQSRDKKLKASRKKKYRRHRRKFSWQTHKWRGYMMGQLNVHVWQAWCGNTIHDLRRNWFFPLYPDLRLTVRRFYVKHYEYDYGQRVFGYLHPPLTGKYIFALSSDDTSELWLSTDENPENVQLLSWVGNLTGFEGNYRTYYAQFTKYNSQISKEIYLEKDKKYFVEALHKQGARRDHILVGWKIPGLPGFRYITGNSISMYIYDTETSPDVTQYAGYIPQTIASHIRPRNWSMVLNKNVHKFGTKSRSDMKYRSEKAPHFDLDYMLYECKYEPSYLVKNFSLNRYEGVKLIHDSAVYPNDHTAFTHMKRFDKCLHRRAIDSHGNSLHLKQPTLSNHSLYDEGSITVFADDDKGSIVMLYSDLAETYTMADGDNEEILNSDKLVARSLNESVKLVSDIYENADVSQSLVEDETIQTNDPRKIGNTAQFSFKESYRDNTKLVDPRNRNHGNNRQFDARNSHQGNRRKYNSVHKDVGKSDQLGDRNRHQWNTNHFNSRNGNGDSRHGNTIQFVPKNNHHDNVDQAGYENNPILDSETVRNSERVTRTAPMHVRPKRVRREQQSNNKQVNNVENLRNHLEQISLSDNDNSQYNTHQQYGELRRNREISRKRGKLDSYDQTVNPDRGQSTQDFQQEFANHIAQKVNQGLENVKEALKSGQVNSDSSQVNPDSKQVNTDSKQVNPDSKHVEPDSKQVNRDSKQVNPDLNRDHGHVTLRKLMGVYDAPRDNRDNQANQPNQVSQSRQINRANGIKQAMLSSQAHLVNQTNQDTTQQDDSDVDDNGTEDDDDNETDDNDDDDDSDVEGMANQALEDTLEEFRDDYPDVDDFPDNEGRNQPTRPVQSSSVPGQVIYFNPARAPQNQSYQQFQLSETILSRIDAARDYVRRMIKVVQIYKYQITKKQLADQILRRFGIRMEVPELEIYYEYDAWLYHHNTTKCTTDGNILLSENVAHSVVLRFMRSLDNYIPNRFQLDRIINVEENHDIVNGDRYLVELELFDIKLNRTVSSSQYIYQPIGYSHFCSPQHFSINHEATVHVIIPVKNQGRWVQYFIEDMSELYVTTGDANINVIIVDFSSDDIDIQDALERSPLKRYRVITLTGPFQRAFGIQAGAAVITNPNDIIFMCDLHLEIPNNMIDIIRKHCIQGRMAFAPIVTRLHCGFTPSIPYGFWELQGYGLFAMYKSDFSRVGGMNYREFGTRWGGEDWELLDRVLLHRMEVERLRVPNFYHFYHSKKGMWGSPTVDTVTSDIGAQYYRDKNQIIPLYKPARVRIISADDPLVQTIHDADTVTERTRHLRSKRPAPSRVIRSASRVRRGYRQPAKPKGYDKNGGRLYRKR